MSKKIEMAFDISALTEFKNENTGLVQELIFKPTTIASGIDVIVGQKGTFKLNNLSSDIYLQASACGWTVSGSTTFGQQEVVLKTIDFKEALCAKTLTSKWMSQVMRDGSNPEELPFEKFILDSKVKGVAAENEKMFWRGDTSTGTGNLGLVNGMAAFLSGATGSIYSEASSGTTTSANVITKVKTMITSMGTNAPELLDQDDLALYMSSADYLTFIMALNDALYPVTNQDQAKPYGKSFNYLGVEVIGTNGLNSEDFWYLSSKKNFVLGTDLTSDEENIEIWYSQDNREYRVAGTYKIGVAAYFPSLVIQNNPNIAV